MIASVFYIGYFPVASGTAGSLAALALYFFIRPGLFVMTVVIVACIVIGFLSSGNAERVFGKKDPSEIVIDEFSGMLVSLFMLPVTLGYVISAFLLFRFFDILKPWPANRLERLGGGAGIMLDDIAAGIYANIILQVISRII